MWHGWSIFARPKWIAKLVVIMDYYNWLQHKFILSNVGHTGDCSSCCSIDPLNGFRVIEIDVFPPNKSPLLSLNEIIFQHELIDFTDKVQRIGLIVALSPTMERAIIRWYKQNCVCKSHRLLSQLIDFIANAAACLPGLLSLATTTTVQWNKVNGPW